MPITRIIGSVIKCSLFQLGNYVICVVLEQHEVTGVKFEPSEIK